ncbi:MAG: hypothetical protein J6R94_02585 [Agathobacter sp.]|nr:hypothetical protein [Agathobacter sp.]
MQTPREALLAIMRGEPADYIPCKALHDIGVVFPGERYFGTEEEGYDAWGVRWTQLGPDPGLDGSTPTPGYQRLKDIANWKTLLPFPDLDAMHASDILKAMAQGEYSTRTDCIRHVLCLSGPWERLNQVLGMADALMSFYDEPEAVHEFLDAMVDYKIRCIDIANAAVDPDVFHLHDDWGTGNSMFFSPEIWREFIKPGVKRICDHIHSLGKLYEHHSCGYITPIIPDLAEIGVDVINPLNVSNHMEWIKEEFGHKITLCGGVDNQAIDKEDVAEDVIRREARRVMDAYAHGGRYLPDFIYTNRRVKDIFCDEVERYGKQIHM